MGVTQSSRLLLANVTSLLRTGGSKQLISLAACWPPSIFAQAAVAALFSSSTSCSAAAAAGAGTAAPAPTCSGIKEQQQQQRYATGEQVHTSVAKVSASASAWPPPHTLLPHTLQSTPAFRYPTTHKHPGHRQRQSAELLVALAGAGAARDVGHRVCGTRGAAADQCARGGGRGVRAGCGAQY